MSDQTKLEAEATSQALRHVQDQHALNLEDPLMFFEGNTFQTTNEPLEPNINRSDHTNLGHSFSQTVCGNFFDEFLDEFLGDFFFTLPRTRPKSFLLGRIACKLENRS